jgi:hypothetical protein
MSTDIIVWYVAGEWYRRKTELDVFFWQFEKCQNLNCVCVFFQIKLRFELCCMYGMITVSNWGFTC